MQYYWTGATAAVFASLCLHSFRRTGRHIKEVTTRTTMRHSDSDEKWIPHNLTHPQTCFMSLSCDWTCTQSYVALVCPGVVTWLWWERVVSPVDCISSLVLAARRVINCVINASGSYIQYISISLLNYPRMHFWKWHEDRGVCHADPLFSLSEGWTGSQRKRLLRVICW